MTQEVLKLAFEAFQYVVTPSGGTRAYVWDSSEARLVADAYRALEKALAQPEQEPVQWGVDWGKAGDIPCVSIVKRFPNGGIQFLAVEYAPYNYTTPPQRTWVGLTLDEKSELWEISRAALPRYATYASLIEAKLKERNG